MAPAGGVGEAGQPAHVLGGERQARRIDGAAPLVRAVAAPVEHQRDRLQDHQLAQQIGLGHRLEADEPVRILEAAAREQLQQLVAAHRGIGVAVEPRRDLGGPAPERRAGRPQRAGLRKIIARERGTGVGRTGQQDAAALAVGVGGSERGRIVRHGGGEIAREFDRGAQLSLVCEGAPVEQAARPEVGVVQGVIAPAETGLLAGAGAVAIDAGDGLEAGGVPGGGAGTVDDGAVAGNAPGLGSGGAGMGILGGGPRGGEAGQAGDRPAGALARPARPHGLGLGGLAGDLRLQLRLRVERPGHGLGALGRVAGELAGLKPQRLDDAGLHDVDLAGQP